MKRIPLVLMVLGSAILGAALVVGIMLIAEPWGDSAQRASGRSETEATVIAETWANGWMLGRSTTVACEALEYDSGDWFLTCYEILANGEPRITVTVRLPDDEKAPRVLQCEPIDGCETRHLIPEAP